MNATLNFTNNFTSLIINLICRLHHNQACNLVNKYGRTSKTVFLFPPSLFQGTKNIHDSISKNFTSHITAPPERPPFQMQTYKKHFKPPKNHHTFFPKKTPLLPKTFHTFAFGQWRYRPHTY